MNLKTGVLGAVALVVILVAGSWLWSASDAPRGLFGAGDPAGVDPANRTGSGDSQELSGSKRSATNPGGNRANSESGIPSSEATRPNSGGGADAAIGPDGTDGSTGGLRAGNGRDKENSRSNDKSSEQGESGRGDPLRGLPTGFSDGTAGADPAVPDAEGPTPEELDRHDLDLDEEISPWEVEKTRRLDMRAENYPKRNDRGDGAYPIESENSPLSESDFNNVDTNGDGLMDKEEYYRVLVNAERALHLHDENGDKQLSQSESGLSSSDFDSLDSNNNKSLSDREIRRAVPKGFFPEAT